MSTRRFLTGLAKILLTLLMLSGCKFESSITSIDMATAPPAPDFAFGTLEPSFSTIDPLIVDPTPDNEIDNRESRVQAAIDAGDYQLAIDLVIELYNIDISNAAGVPQYNPNLFPGYYATTDPTDGSIEVGSDAFASPGILASTLGHEAVHANQIAEGRAYLGVDESGEVYIIDLQGVYLNELEAWRWELEHAMENGLSDTEIIEIRNVIDGFYDLLNDENKALADNDIYELPTPGSESP